MMWSGFKSRRPRHMWVEFVVGSLPCSERFFSGYSGFPLSSKTSTSKFQFDQELGRRRTTLWMCYLQIIIYLFYSFKSKFAYWQFNKRPSLQAVTQEASRIYTSAIGNCPPRWRPQMFPSCVSFSGVIYSDLYGLHQSRSKLLVECTPMADFSLVDLQHVLLSARSAYDRGWTTRPDWKS